MPISKTLEPHDATVYQPPPGGNVHDIVVAMLPGPGPRRVLDAAAGQGHVGRRMAQLGYEVVSADLSFDPGQVFPGETVVADFNRGLPFADRSFDGVVSVETIEHIENPWEFARELGRVTRPGGFVIVTTPNTTNVHSRALMLARGQIAWFRASHVDPLGHITPIFPHLLREMMRRAGFSPQEVRFSEARLPWSYRRLPVTNALLGECRIERFRRDG
jgi:SAM-dependent methyltransferase